MQMVLITKEELRALIKEVVIECLVAYVPAPTKTAHEPEPLLTRKAIKEKLNISYVTLNDWKNRGLPSHKQRGRIFYLYSEVLEYIKSRSKMKETF